MGERPVSSVGTAEYDRLLAVIKAARQKVRIPQRALSIKMGKSTTFMDKVERGVRRLDVVEFCELAVALGEDPRALFAQFADPIYMSSDERRKL